MRISCGRFRDGLPASAMPYFADLLSAEELAAVVQEVKSFSTAFSRARNPIEIPAPLPSSPESVGRGKALFVSQGCAGCHGDDGRGGRTLNDGSGRKVFARDLTAPWTFRGGSRAEDIWLRLTTGIMPGPMPAYGDALSADFSLGSGELRRLARPHASLGKERRLRRRRICRRPKPARRLSDPLGGLRPLPYADRPDRDLQCRRAFLAGGMRVGYYPYGYSVSSNLTSDPETGLAGGASRRSSERCATARRRTGRSTRSRCSGPLSTTSRARTRRPSRRS